MRTASWVFVLCAVLTGAGVFLPSIELQLHGSAVSRRTELSLYRIAADRETARRLLAMYRSSNKRRLGAKILHTVSPRVTGRIHAALDDARDAMDTLDEVSDDQARITGIALVAALGALLVLDAIAAALVFGELMRGSFRRGRHAAALIAAVLVTAIAVALHLACRELVWEANDEVSRTVLALGPGAYVLPLAAIAGFFLAIVLVAKRRTAAAGGPRGARRR